VPYLHFGTPRPTATRTHGSICTQERKNNREGLCKYAFPRIWSEKLLTMFRKENSFYFQACSCKTSHKLVVSYSCDRKQATFIATMSITSRRSVVCDRQMAGWNCEKAGTRHTSRPPTNSIVRRNRLIRWLIITIQPLLERQNFQLHY